MISPSDISRRVLFGALALVCASTAFAQTATTANDPSAPKTRAQVKQEFIAWRAAGYDPNDWLGYPDNAIRAGRIVAAQHQPPAPVKAN